MKVFKKYYRTRYITNQTGRTPTSVYRVAKLMGIRQSYGSRWYHEDANRLISLLRKRNT